MDYHQHQLGNVCRVCGLKTKKSKKYSPVYDCQEFSTHLLKTFNIEVLHDNPLVHPPSFCSLCYGIVRRTTAALDSGTIYTPAGTPNFHWEPHSEQKCRVRCCGEHIKIFQKYNSSHILFLCFKVCEHFHTMSRGGRPITKDKMKPGRPKGVAVGPLLKILRDMAPPSNFYSELRPEVCLNDNLTCPVCIQLLDRPLDTMCGSTICVECLCQWICFHDIPSCPCCHTDYFDHTHIKNTSILFCSILNSSVVKCPRMWCSIKRLRKTYGP